MTQMPNSLQMTQMTISIQMTTSLQMTQMTTSIQMTQMTTSLQMTQVTTSLQMTQMTQMTTSLQMTHMTTSLRMTQMNTAAQDSNPGSRSRECEALPLSYCTLLRCDSVVRHIASLFVNIRLFVCFISQRCVVNKCSSLTVQGSGLLSRWRQHDLNLLLHECVR